jgi:hypothetical protein
MQRPDDVKIKLCADHPTRASDGTLGYTMTPIGFSLYQLSEWWDMSYEQVIAKIASAAHMEEERFIVDGWYVKPHRRIVPCEADYV